MVLLAYRHGLRALELVDLRWDQIDFDSATLAVRRAKKGTPSTHPIRVTNCGHCAGCIASRIPSRHSCSRPNAVRRSPRRGLPGLSSVRGGGWLRVQGPSAHAAPRLRLRPGQQGPRHAGAAGLSGPPQHPAHGALYRVVAGSVQRLLAARSRRAAPASAEGPPSLRSNPETDPRNPGREPRIGSMAPKYIYIPQSVAPRSVFLRGPNFRAACFVARTGWDPVLFFYFFFRGPVCDRAVVTMGHGGAA